MTGWKPEIEKQGETLLDNGYSASLLALKNEAYICVRELWLNVLRNI